MLIQNVKWSYYRSRQTSKPSGGLPLALPETFWSRTVQWAVEWTTHYAGLYISRPICDSECSCFPATSN